VTVQTIPETEMMMRLVTDVSVIVDWLRADNFTSKQLIAVRKPALSNIKAVKEIPVLFCITVRFFY